MVNVYGIAGIVFDPLSIFSSFLGIVSLTTRLIFNHLMIVYKS